TLPAFDTLSRVTCRVMEHVRRLSREQLHGFKKKMREILVELVDRYIGRAQRLLDHLEPILDTPYSLALRADSETLDYPLRALRLAGYLAIAGLACLDREDSDRAPRFADALARLARSNEGGVLSPIADDQIIELAAMWMLWLRTDRSADVVITASRLIERMVIRKQTDRPLPALWQSARMPMDAEAVGTLVAAH